jgi:hypothetical protein
MWDMTGSLGEEILAPEDHLREQVLTREDVSAAAGRHMGDMTGSFGEETAM